VLGVLFADGYPDRAALDRDEKPERPVALRVVASEDYGGVGDP
jgi:hypothetical protein